MTWLGDLLHDHPIIPIGICLAVAFLGGYACGWGAKR
jgi:hypothetical protein